MTVILVTHDREEALSMSDRIALMFEGALIQTGTPKEVYTRPATRQAADYFGNCVYIRGRAENGRFRACGIDYAADEADGEYDIMLRPDCLHTDKEGSYSVTVELVLFRGSDTQVTFRAEDGTLWKKTFVQPAHWNAGDILQADLVVKEMILFKAD